MISKLVILKTYHKEEKQFERITWQAETLLDGCQQVKWLEFGREDYFSFLQPNGVVAIQLILLK